MGSSYDLGETAGVTEGSRSEVDAAKSEQSRGDDPNGDPSGSRFTEAEQAVNRGGTFLRNLGVIVGAVVALCGGAIWWSVGRGTDETAQPVVEISDVDCVNVFDGECNFYEAPPSGGQVAWQSLELSTLRPDDWETVETWSTLEPLLFRGVEQIELEGDEQLESGRATLIDNGFALEITDRDTVTANLGEWTGPWDPPFYAAVTVVQSGGPLETRACGIQFNVKFDVDYEELANRWLMAKASGADAQVTRWAPRNDEGLVEHPVYELYENVIDSQGPIRIEILVRDEGWSAAIDGRVVASRSESLGASIAFPAAQQETQWRTGNVVCRFTDWELAVPAG